MGRIEWAGQGDREAVFAHHVGMAEAAQQQPLIRAEVAVLIFSLVGLGRELLEGVDALGRQPVERRFRLDGAQYEIATGARKRQRACLHGLPVCRKVDEPSPHIVKARVVPQSERCKEERMQAGIAAGERGDLGDAGVGEAIAGEGLQGRAVVGASEPGASECRERCSWLRRVVDGEAGKAGTARRGPFLLLVVDSGTIEHLILPQRTHLNGDAHAIRTNSRLWRCRDRFRAIEGRCDEDVMNQIFRNCEGRRVRCGIEARGKTTAREE